LTINFDTCKTDMEKSEILTKVLAKGNQMKDYFEDYLQRQPQFQVGKEKKGKGRKGKRWKDKSQKQ